MEWSGNGTMGSSSSVAGRRKSWNDRALSPSRHVVFTSRLTSDQRGKYVVHLTSTRFSCRSLLPPKVQITREALEGAPFVHTIFESVEVLMLTRRGARFCSSLVA